MRIWFISLFLVLFTYKSFASQQPSDGGIQDENFWQGVGRDLASPVTTSASEVLWPGLGVESVLLLTQSQFSDKIQPQIAREQPLGSTSNFGNIMGKLVPNALYAGGMLGYYEWSGSSLALRRAILMFKATLYAGLVTDSLKVITRERRPNGSSDLASFPSGHTTVAFAFASVVGAEHAWYYGVGAYALASFVGFSRMNDNKHYLHDVAAGALIGTVYGLGLYNRDIEKNGSTKIHHVSLVPVVTPDVSYLDVSFDY